MLKKKWDQIALFYVGATQPCKYTCMFSLDLQVSLWDLGDKNLKDVKNQI